MEYGKEIFEINVNDENENKAKAQVEEIKAFG